MTKSLFRWWPLGGLGEVGMNTMAFDFGGLVVPVDAGIAFADANDFGIEAVHPDYTELLRTHRPPYWLITHAHEDHIGAVASVLDSCGREGIECPEILAPPLAAALIRERLTDELRYPDAKPLFEKIKDIAPDSKLEHGDLTIHFLQTRHSTLDTCSLAFEWKNAGTVLRVVHTADFKLDSHAFEDGVRTVESIYGVFGGERPDFLFIDSTNAERPGHSVSEADVLPGLDRLISGAEGRVFVTLFSSNIQRIASLVELAAKRGRYSCLMGRSMQTAHRIAMDLGLYGTSCGEMLLGHLRDASELSRQPAKKQLIICSGSQGEPRSVLQKIASDTHPDFDLGSGDRVIFSSKLIPGNEKSVSRLINGLLRSGAEIIWGDAAKEQAGGPIHASGHARRDEIAAVMSFLKPHHVVPVHGELHHLMACAAIARERGPAWGLADKHIHVCENGMELVFESEGEGWLLKERKLPEAPLARLLRFDAFVAPSTDSFLKVRKRASHGGLLAVCLDSMGRMRVDAQGMFPNSLFEGSFREDFEADVEKWLFAKYRQLGAKAFRSRNETLERELADELGRHVRRLTGVRPFVSLQLMGE